MMIPIIYYTIYILISVALTIWVARTLFKNGILFLEDAFSDKEIAKAVNHLLLVGFYLVNLGIVLLYLRDYLKPTDAVQAIEYLSTKIGTVLLVLGGMHFFNMFNFAKMRSKLKKRPSTKSTKSQPQSTPATPTGEAA